MRAYNVKKREVVMMSDILLNDKELKERDELVLFVESLKPEMFERLKAIVWWESMKPKEQGEAKTAV